MLTNMGGGVYVNAPVRLNNLIIMENISMFKIILVRIADNIFWYKLD